MFGGFKRFRACVNAMNAKMTWQTLSEAERKNVDMQARLLYVTGGRPATSGDDLIKASELHDRFKKFNEFELYSLYSMGMIEGFIMPATPEPWDPPSNPLILRIKQVDVEKASHHCKSRYGIDVTLRLLNERKEKMRDSVDIQPQPSGVGWSRAQPRLSQSPFPVRVGRSGVVERMYELGRFKALLLRKPKAVGPVEYRFMFSVVAEDGTPVLLISSERNVMTSGLLKMAAKEFPDLSIATEHKGFFLCVVDHNGNRQNLGSSRDWEDMDRFAERAVQLAKQQLKVYGVNETYRRKDRTWQYLAAAAITLSAVALVFIVFR
jgi:hypothetical protein